MAKLTRFALRYGVAVLAVAISIAFLAMPEIGKGSGAILYLAVLVAAWYGGLGPGLLSTALIAVFAIAVTVNGPDKSPSRIAGIVFFVGGGVLAALLVEAASRVSASGRNQRAVGYSRPQQHRRRRDRH